MGHYLSFHGVFPSLLRACLNQYFLSLLEPLKGSALDGGQLIFLVLSEELGSSQVTCLIDRVPRCKQQNELIKLKMINDGTETVTGHQCG